MTNIPPNRLLNTQVLNELRKLEGIVAEAPARPLKPVKSEHIVCPYAENVLMGLYRRCNYIYDCEKKRLIGKYGLCRQQTYVKTWRTG